MTAGGDVDSKTTIFPFLLKASKFIFTPPKTQVASEVASWYYISFWLTVSLRAMHNENTRWTL